MKEGEKLRGRGTSQDLSRINERGQEGKARKAGGGERKKNRSMVGGVNAFPPLYA